LVLGVIVEDAAVVVAIPADSGVSVLLEAAGKETAKWIYKRLWMLMEGLRRWLAVGIG